MARFPGNNQQEGQIAPVPKANPPPAAARGGSSNRSRGKGRGKSDPPIGSNAQAQSLMDLVIQGRDIPCMGCSMTVTTLAGGYRCNNCNLNVQEHITEKARQVYQKSIQGPHPATAEDVAKGKFGKKNP